MLEREKADLLNELQTAEEDETHPEVSLRRTPSPFQLSEGSRATFAEASDGIAEFLPGDRITDQFEVVRILGRGSMGIVYKVMDAITAQPLALKIFRPSLMAKAGASERFVKEVNIGRRLRHPGIVGIYDVRQEGPLLFYTMEYVRGEPLRQLMSKFGPLSLGKACGVIYRVCRILQEAHQYVIHCDLSPNNILVMPDASLRLVDFGIARTLDRADRTVLSKSNGSYSYIAPEQWQDPEHVGPWTDVYSLGVIFFEMLTGQIPTAYNRLSDLRPDLPHCCEQLMRYTLAPIRKRCRSAQDMRTAVKHCIREWAKLGGMEPGDRGRGGKNG